MGYLKYGKDRHQPPGTWVQATHLTEVAGLAFRKPKVFQFARAVRKAELRGLPYGLTIERQPNNPIDPNAIAVYGVADMRGLLGIKRHQWHIGFVPAEVSADVTPNLIEQGVPVGVELYQMVEGSDGYFEVKFFILAPPGYGVAKRMKSSGPDQAAA